MTPICSASLLSTTCFAISLAAQSATWIVDVNNGPGTNFTSLQAAIYGAAAGDLLLVRTGTYQPTFLDRPLTIVADGNVVIAGSGGYMPGFMIAPIPAGTAVAITGVTFAATALSRESLRIAGGAGTVILDRVQSALVTTLSYADDVRITRSRFDQGVAVNHATVAMDRCTIDPFERSFSSLVNATLMATDSHVVLNRCQVTGDDVYLAPGFHLPPTSAVSLASSTLVVCDDGSGALAAGTEVGVATPAITGTGTVELDPQAVLLPTGGAPAVTIANVVTRIRPSLAVDAGGPGGVVAIDLFGPAGDGYLEALGFAVTPTIDPALQDRLWVRPILLWSIGTFGPSGRIVQQIPLPNSPVVVGISFTWQAVSFGAVSGLALSNPVSYVHPN